MFERMILAVIITFCAYVFFNVGQQSSNSSIIEAKPEVVPELTDWVASFSF